MNNVNKNTNDCAAFNCSPIISTHKIFSYKFESDKKQVFDGPLEIKSCGSLQFTLLK